jgi:hypothetical protein
MVINILSCVVNSYDSSYQSIYNVEFQMLSPRIRSLSLLDANVMVIVVLEMSKSGTWEALPGSRHLASRLGWRDPRLESGPGEGWTRKR